MFELSSTYDGCGPAPTDCILAGPAHPSTSAILDVDGKWWRFDLAKVREIIIRAIRP